MKLVLDSDQVAGVHIDINDWIALKLHYVPGF
jgi:hypothetical protein